MVLLMFCVEMKEGGGCCGICFFLLFLFCFFVFGIILEIGFDMLVDGSGILVCCVGILKLC